MSWVLTIPEEEFIQMKRVLLDEDREEAFRLIKHIIARLERQSQAGLKSHLDR